MSLFSKIHTLELTDRTDFKERMNALLELDRGSTAVLTIDLQRKYLDQEIGESKVPPEIGDRVIQANAAFLDSMRRLEIPIIHAYVTRRPVEVSGLFPVGVLPYVKAAAEMGLSQIPGKEVTMTPDRLAGSDQSELVEAIVDAGDYHIDDKKSWDSFQFTDLDYLLRWIFNVDTLLIAGINTDTCVYATVLSAGNHGYKPVVVADCVASMRGEDSHAMALELMARSVAWVMSADEIDKKLNQATDKELKQ